MTKKKAVKKSTKKGGKSRAVKAEPSVTSTSVAEFEILGFPNSKSELLVLYKLLQDLGVRSISNLENLIARAE